MPHDAAERVCPNSGLRLPENTRPPPTRSRALDALPDVPGRPRSSMSEMPPPPRAPEPFARAAKAKAAATNDDKDEEEDKHPLVGETVGGRYRVKGVLGEGGMGTVYDAEHIGLSRQVAIKVLSPSQAKKRVAVKRFQQEARAAGAIGHPNICEVYDLGLLEDGSPYLVMEKLVGQTLAERISKEGGLPFEDVIEVLVQVLSGLVAAHDKGIVHRDIKPENIFLAQRVGSRPIIKLLDFGVSKMMPEFQQGGEDGLDLTRTGMVMGTPYYMSPEQARGERNLDGRVDVYACGVVMYEAIAGRRPFLAPNYNALLLAIINTNPRGVRELRPKTPPELEEILRRAMAKNRDDRYATAKHFLRELSPPTEASRIPSPPSAEERKRAPMLGGNRIQDTARASALVRPLGLAPVPPPPESASAALHVNMRGVVERDRPTQMTRPSDPSTHFDFKRPIPAPAVSPQSAPSFTAVDPPRPEDPDSGAVRGAMESEPSFDIPIDVDMGDDDDAEDRTEIWDHDVDIAAFRANLAAAAPPPASSARVLPTRTKQPDEDWDSETVVNRPELLISKTDMLIQPGPPNPARTERRPPKPFNPDETVKLDTIDDIEIFDTPIDHQAASTPRRRR